MNKLCQEKDSDISITVRKLAIVSQLELFKDIIPGYVDLINICHSRLQCVLNGRGEGGGLDFLPKTGGNPKFQYFLCCGKCVYCLHALLFFTR